MKTYRVTIFMEYGMGMTRVQAANEWIAIAKATARLYDRDDGQITGVEVEQVN